MTEDLTTRQLANAQRRSREEMLTRLPPTVSDLLTRTEFLVAPESQEIERHLFSYAEGRPGEPSPGYSYGEFDDKTTALARAMGGHFSKTTETAYLFCGRRLPVFKVRFDWGIENLRELLGVLGPPVWLATVDLRRGVTFDAYGDATRCERFQVATWGAE